VRQVFLLCGLGSLLFLVACGSGNNGSTFTPAGNFSAASVSGQYTYQFSGIDLTTNASYVRAGVFTADGAGAITSGTDDFTEGSTAVSNPITGTYSVSNDGTGSATLTIAGATISYGLTLVSASKVYLIELDTGLVGAGVAEKQNTAAFSATPSGTFAFRMHTTSPTLLPTASVGVTTISGGVVTGNEDANINGAITSTTLTGSFNAPDTVTGRGTATLTDSLGATSTFVYYVVDTSNLRLFSTTSATVGLGRAQLQSGAPFSNASLNGGFAFGMKGDTASLFNGFQAVGRFTSDGNGNISAGAEDAAQDGTISSNVSFSGTYSMASNGRAAVTVNGSGLPTQLIIWMVSPSRAFVLVNGATPVADGTLDAQQSAAFTNSSIVGQFGFVMDGFDTSPITYDRVGTLSWDGAGHLTLNELINASGSLNSAVLSGSYSVAQNGRATGSISNLSSNLVFYFISGNDGYVLQADQGFELAGMISKQP